MTRLTYTTQELVQVSYAHMTLSSPFSPPAQTDSPQYPPQSTQIQPPHVFSNFVDGSGPIFSQYLEMAKEEDERMADNWKADADGILIFVRHHSILESCVRFTPTHGLIDHRPVYSPLPLRP